MSAADTWMPLYVGKFLSATSHLNTEETGAYLLLLMGAWERGGRLPNNDDQLGRISRCSPEQWIRIKYSISSFFDITQDHWTQRRLLKEKQKAEKNLVTFTERAKKAAQARWNGHNASSMQQALHKHSLSNAPEGTGIGIPLHGESTERGNAEIPSLEEVTVYGSKNKVSLELCKHFFDYYQGNNLWINQFNRLIDWRVKLLSWRDDPRNSLQINGKQVRLYPRDIKLQMDAIQVQIDQHPANPQSTFKVPNPTDLQRASLRALRKQWGELNQQQAKGICTTTQ